jgi:hypothetical protein
LLYLQDARVPFMLLDALVVYGLTTWEKRIKEEKEKAAAEDGMEHEEEKKKTMAEKAQTRQTRKEQQKKTNNMKNGGASFVPKQNINQPDKSKKSR